MKTLTEKYKAVLEGKYNRKQFVRDARLSHPNHITQYNGFDDTVAILKNRGLVFEISDDELGRVLDDLDSDRRAIEDPDDSKLTGRRGLDVEDPNDELGFIDDEEELDRFALDYDDDKLMKGIETGRRELREEYEQPEPTFSIEAIERGIDFELEAKGFDTVQIDFTEQDYQKAKTKVLKNLKKNPLYYLLKSSGESTGNKKRSDLMVPADKKNQKDSANAMTKAALKENKQKRAEELIKESFKKLIVEVLSKPKKRVTVDGKAI